MYIKDGLKEFMIHKHDIDSKKKKTHNVIMEH